MYVLQSLCSWQKIERSETAPLKSPLANSFTFNRYVCPTIFLVIIVLHIARLSLLRSAFLFPALLFASTSETLDSLRSLSRTISILVRGRILALNLVLVLYHGQRLFFSFTLVKSRPLFTLQSKKSPCQRSKVGLLASVWAELDPCIVRGRLGLQHGDDDDEADGDNELEILAKHADACCCFLFWWYWC